MDHTPSARLRTITLAFVVAAGVTTSALLSRWLEANRRPSAAAAHVADGGALYVSPEAARRMSLGFNGLVADWYWMRSLQYVGRKVVAHRGDLRLDDLQSLGLDRLAPLLEQTTTLDPEFMAAYEFGAVVLPAVDEAAAISLIEKGIRENPRQWRLLHHLGYIHWTRGRFREASAAYLRGAEIEGAPSWMRVMAAQMEAQGGSRDTARAIYARMIEDADDENVKNLGRLRLAQVDSLDERDAVRRLLSSFRAQAGRCPQGWREVAGALRAARLRTDDSGAPTDPAGFPYVLDSSACEINLNPRSPIPVK
jgi:tetratricopeptide (TPR) repeat protein